MKTTLFACATIMALHGASLAGGEGWTHDFEAAKKQAAAEKKDLLLDFTGSDCCGWCIKLNDEVFKKDAFKAGVKDSFVLVELDFPNDKSKLDEKTQNQNKELGEKYAIQGYPTILLCDATGKPYAATGYKPDGPEKYVEHLNSLRGKKATRDEALAKAAKAEGMEKAKALVSALDAMELDDALVANSYGDIAAQIAAADPKDETGFVKKTTAKKQFAEFQNKLQEFAQKQDHAGALGLVDKTLKDGRLNKNDTQQVMMIRATILLEQKKYDDALKAVDEAKAFQPDSEFAAQIDGFREQIESLKAQSAAKPAGGKADEEEEDDP